MLILLAALVLLLAALWVLVKALIMLVVTTVVALPVFLLWFWLYCKITAGIGWLYNFCTRRAEKTNNQTERK